MEEKSLGKGCVWLCVVWRREGATVKVSSAGTP